MTFQELIDGIDKATKPFVLALVAIATMAAILLIVTGNLVEFKPFLTKLVGVILIIAGLADSSSMTQGGNDAEPG